MTPENFVYWLQGWFELNKTIDHRAGATPETLQVIEDHLKLVFDKKTPDRSIEEIQEETNKRVFQPLIIPHGWDGYEKKEPFCAGPQIDCATLHPDVAHSC